jgi:hypothetical protein
VLSSFYELRKELKMAFASGGFGLAEVLSDETWCNEVFFLADIFQGLNTLNKSMQTKKAKMLACTDNINFYKEKLQPLGNRIKKI